VRALRQHPWSTALGTLFALYVVASLAGGFGPGIEMGREFLRFSLEMLKVLPCVFVVIGLFEVWVKTETVEAHLGHGAGPRSYIWAVLLAGGTVGGLHVALPVANALALKRARLGVVLAFLSAAGICRIPMTLFEASFLGWKFTAVRFAVSLPLVLLTSAATGRWLDRSQYSLPVLEAGAPPDDTQSEERE
jgi:uncharacterized membrane protein YraQ (UPF0718 family)